MGIGILFCNSRDPVRGNMEKNWSFGKVRVNNQFGQQAPCTDRHFFDKIIFQLQHGQKPIFSISHKCGHVNCQNNIQIPIAENVLTNLTKFGRKIIMS